MKKEADTLKDIYVASTHDYLMIFTTLGRCYWIKAWQIPEAEPTHQKEDRSSISSKIYSE